ncbi:MarR family winged helix-turn-helix transcriptional regulator [Sphingobium cloacae]|uniref:HTH marR-type domain-containing protein n=1 Tax=Sphingobium cloacae TaxID=120107 RepID=A0A1E1F471_9SPHN|nr:MarR family transcriptional regulator [Sphingobium cloacae]BAV65315.1 hypothetical protein SCLO_1022750 [Sphingobium cloacae]
MPVDSSLFDLTNAVQPVRRVWGQAANTVITEFGLSPSLGTVVILTSRLGPAVHQKDLALEVGVNPAALVRTLDQGEAAGLLERKVVAGDRRSNVVSLFPRGTELAKAMEQKLAKLRRDLLGDLPVEEIQTAARILRALEERAQAYVRRGQV